MILNTDKLKQELIGNKPVIISTKKQGVEIGNTSEDSYNIYMKYKKSQRDYIAELYYKLDNIIKNNRKLLLKSIGKSFYIDGDFKLHLEPVDDYWFGVDKIVSVRQLYILMDEESKEFTQLFNNIIYLNGKN